jgi:hypothetical protein
MVTNMLNQGWQRYARVVAETGFESACTGAWVGVAGLPAGKRRLARAGIFAASLAVGAAAYRSERRQQAPEPVLELELAVRELSPLQVAVTATALGGSVALTLGSRVLQKRWVDRLVRQGHARPHRALGVRVAAIAFAASLPARLIDAHSGRPRGRQRSE